MSSRGDLEDIDEYSDKRYQIDIADDNISHERYHIKDTQ